MSDRFEEELMDDLFYEEAEGAAELFDEEEEFEDYFEEEEDEFEEEDYFDEEDYLEDEFDEFEDYGDEYDEEEAEEELDSVMAYAMGAESEDEFFRRLFRGVKKFGRKAIRVARKVAPVVGRVARVAAPILSKIPIPQAQIAGRIASILGRLRAEGATEEEAMEAFAELAAKDPKAIPIVAGLGARILVKRKGARMSYAKRKQMVKDVKKAVKTLARKRGLKAVRATPKIVKNVKRTAAIKGTPTSVRAKIVKRTAAKVAKSPTLTRKLSRPSVKGKILAKKTLMKSGLKTIRVPGPCQITITGTV